MSFAENTLLFNNSENSISQIPAAINAAAAASSSSKHNWSTSSFVNPNRTGDDVLFSTDKLRLRQIDSEMSFSAVVSVTSESFHVLFDVDGEVSDLCVPFIDLRVLETAFRRGPGLSYANYATSCTISCDSFSPPVSPTSSRRSTSAGLGAENSGVGSDESPRNGYTVPANAVSPAEISPASPRGAAIPLHVEPCFILDAEAGDFAHLQDFIDETARHHSRFRAAAGGPKDNNTAVFPTTIPPLTVHNEAGISFHHHHQ